MKFTINVDSDGVVYDMQSELIRRAEHRFPGETFELPDRWRLSEAWGISERDVAGLFREPGVFSQGNPYPMAVTAIRALADAGHDVRIVTHKHGLSGKHPMKEALDFYQRVGLLGMVDVVFARGDKTSYPAQIVIDDKPTLQWAQGEAVNVLFDQPWNRHINVGNFPEVIEIVRASGWPDVLELVEQMGGGLLQDKSPVVV